jgi:hypothetical protein
MDDDVLVAVAAETYEVVAEDDSEIVLFDAIHLYFLSVRSEQLSNGCLDRLASEMAVDEDDDAVVVSAVVIDGVTIGGR